MNIIKYFISRKIRRSLLPNCKYAKFPTPFGKFIMPTDRHWSAILRYLYIENTLYEPETVAYLKKHVKTGDVILDIGANFGYYTMLFSTLVQHGIVHAFEPMPENYNILKANTFNRPNVILHKKAISNKVIDTWLYLNRSFGSHGLIPKTRMDGRIPVTTIPLDHYNFERVDWVKIDVEGHEGEVIEGLKNTITKNPQIRFIIEFIPERGLSNAFYEVLKDFQFKGLDENVVAYKTEEF